MLVLKFSFVVNLFLYVIRNREWKPYICLYYSHRQEYMKCFRIYSKVEIEFQPTKKSPKLEKGENERG